jgi:hypothetical protein
MKLIWLQLRQITQEWKMLPVCGYLSTVRYRLLQEPHNSDESVPPSGPIDFSVQSVRCTHASHPHQPPRCEPGFERPGHETPPLCIGCECQQFIQRRAICMCRSSNLRKRDVNYIDFLPRRHCLPQRPSTIEGTVSLSIIPLRLSAQGEQRLRIRFARPQLRRSEATAGLP